MMLSVKKKNARNLSSSFKEEASASSDIEENYDEILANMQAFEHSLAQPGGEDDDGEYAE